jgi:hypothetical protein
MALGFARHIADERKEISGNSLASGSARQMQMPNLIPVQCWILRPGTAVLVLSARRFMAKREWLALEMGHANFRVQAAHQPAFAKQFLANALWRERPDPFALFRSASVTSAAAAFRASGSITADGRLDSVGGYCRRQK